MSKTSSKRRYVVPSTSPPTTSSDSSGWEDEGKEDPKKKRKCTRKHKPDYNESSTKAHMRESYVFSTALANLAASAVKHRMCDTIIAYHQGIPREPNKLTIKPPKISSSKFSTFRKSPKGQNDKNSINTSHDKTEEEEDEEETTPVKKSCNKKEKQMKKKKEEYCYNSPSTVKSPNSRIPLTPPRSPPPSTTPRKPSPDIPAVIGEYALTLSERIKCRSRACAPKVNYSDDKEEVKEGGDVTEGVKSRKSSLSRSRNKDVLNKSDRRRSRSITKHDSDDDDEELTSPRPTRSRSKPLDLKRSKSSSSEAAMSLKSDSESKPSLKSPLPEAKPEVKPVVVTPVTSPIPFVSPELAALIVQAEQPSKEVKEPKELKEPPRPSLFEAALKSPSRVKPKTDKPKPLVSPRSKKEGGFKPVKLTSQSSTESNDPDQPLSKFKPLPIGGITPSPQKKNRSFKFRTTQGSKHDMKFVDSIFTSGVEGQISQESSPASTPKEPDTPKTPTSQQPIQKTSHPKPELVIGSPNLGSSKPPPLVVPYSPRLTVVTPHPPHMTAHVSSARSGPISLAGPPPLSSPKFTLAHVSPNKNKARSPEDIIRIPIKVSVGQKCNNGGLNKGVTVKTGTRTITLPTKRGTDSDPPPPEKKKKRFVFPTEDTTPLLKNPHPNDLPKNPSPSSPINVTSPISPPSGSPISVRGPGSTRVSPISPQTAVENIQSTPAPTPLRNGIPIHKASPKNSPQSRRTPLDFLADFSGRRSPLAINISKDTPKTSPLTPKVSPSTAGQFYQPNIALSHNSCSMPTNRGELKLSESVIEHSKLSAHQLNNSLPRQPVVTINHQQVTFDQERLKEATLKQRIAVENNQRAAQQQAADERIAKHHQQEMLARQQLLSRAFSPYHLAGAIPTTSHSKMSRQHFELSQQFQQQDIGSLVDLYGRTGELGKLEKEQRAAQVAQMQRPLQHPAFPTHLKPSPRQASPQAHHPTPRQPSPRTPTQPIISQPSPARPQQRTALPSDQAHQERERLLTQQHERLLAQQRQHAQEMRPHYSPQHYQTAQLHHLPYGGVLNPYGAVLNPQLYKQLAESTSAQVTSASLLQSLAGYQQLQLAAAAGKLGPLAHLYRDSSKPPGNGTKASLKTPSQFGVIRP